MAECKTCGAPVNLAPDGDPKFEPKFMIGHAAVSGYEAGRDDTNEQLHAVQADNARLRGFLGALDEAICKYGISKHNVKKLDDLLATLRAMRQLLQTPLPENAVGELVEKAKAVAHGGGFYEEADAIHELGKALATFTGETT